MEDFCDGEFFSKHPLYSVHRNALQIFFYFDEVEYCNPLKTKGNEYKHGVGIILGVDDDDLPQIGCVQDIYVIDNNKVLFSVKKFSTTCEPHFRAYMLHEEDVIAFLYLTDLFVRTPVHIRTSRTVGSNKFVILPHALCTQ